MYSTTVSTIMKNGRSPSSITSCLSLHTLTDTNSSNCHYRHHFIYRYQQQQNHYNDRLRPTQQMELRHTTDQAVEMSVAFVEYGRCVLRRSTPYRDRTRSTQRTHTAPPRSPCCTRRCVMSFCPAKTHSNCDDARCSTCSRQERQAEDDRTGDNLAENCDHCPPMFFLSRYVFP